MSGPLAKKAAVGQLQRPLATIDNLPIEIFHKIIPLVVLREQADGYYYRLRCLRLVAASWSALIDDYPQFWSIIISRDSEPIRRMALQKSKTAEIDVDSDTFYGSTDYPTMLVKELVHHMPRVRKLVILDGDLEYLIASAPTAPRLRSLRIRGRPDVDVVNVPSLHPALWAPNLRDVDLYCSRIEWKEPLWNNLERLYIELGGWTGGLSMEGIFTVLEASPRLRYLDLQGIKQSTRSSHHRTLPIVKLEALETLKLNVKGSPLEALKAIVASPTCCRVYFHDEDENRQIEALRTVGKLVSGIADGDEAGTVLRLLATPQRNMFTMGGLGVTLYSSTPGTPNPLVTCAHFLEGQTPHRRSAVKTLEMVDTDSAWLHGLLPIVNSFCPNIFHLEISALNETLASALGGTDEEWLFPRLESLFIASYPGHLNAIKAVEPRLKAFEAGKRVAKLKKLSFFSIRAGEMDEVALAELKTLVPELILHHVIPERM